MTSSLKAMAVLLAIAASTALGNEFANVHSTGAGYSTWDSDLIDMETVSQDGSGVYVAVLDTGLVPNWRDYFPRARVATELGAGFFQPLTFKSKPVSPCGVETEVGRGPFPGFPGYSHLPWSSRGIGELVSGHLTNFFYLVGTSMASPHVAAVAALMLQKNPRLTQAQVESILRATALPLPAAGMRVVFDGFESVNVSWDGDCEKAPCDAVGAGLVRAGAAVGAVP